MWDYIDWEVFDEFGKVAPDISHCNVKWLLQLNEPVTVCNLFSWEQVLVLGHLSKTV